MLLMNKTAIIYKHTSTDIFTKNTVVTFTLSPAIPGQDEFSMYENETCDSGVEYELPEGFEVRDDEYGIKQLCRVGKEGYSYKFTEVNGEPAIEVGLEVIPLDKK